MFSSLINLKNKIKSILTPVPEKIIVTQAGTGISANYVSGHGYGSGYGSGDKFPGGMGDRGATGIVHDHFTIRQRARTAMYDSPELRSIPERFADTVVDIGLKVKPTPQVDVLGITPEAGEEWAENTAESFHLWAKSKKSHQSRINNFYQNQRLYQIFQQRDNDIFTRFFYGKDKDQINPLSIDFTDPNQIRGNSYTSSYYQTNNDDGIIRDKNTQRETGYKIWYYDSEQMEYKNLDVPAQGPKSGRIMMIHGFNPEYAGQGRGFSRLTHVLQDFEELSTFKISVIKKAISQSALAMAVENDQQDASNPVEGRVSGPVQQYASPPEPSAAAQNVLDEPIVDYSIIPEATFHDPGAVGVFNLKQGDKLTFLKDTSPSESFSTFVDSFCSYLCASMGMPLEILLMKFNQNYSASRAALILFWRVAQVWRDEMAADFLDPVFEMWLSEEIAAGRIKAPGWLNPLMKEAWLCKEWSGAPMPNIDPLKTAQSDLTYVEMSAQTLDDVARNLNGSSGKANRIKNERQFKDLPKSPFAKAPAEKGEEDKEDKEDKEDDE